jgi:DNA polymerase III epsilon subunit-like protein
MRIAIDLETLGTSANAPILSIGLVAFNAGGIVDRHEWFPDMQGQLNAGAVPDASTILWWFSQGPEARIPQVEAKRQPAMQVLAEIGAVFARYDVVEVWGNGPSFDCTIPTELFRRHGLSAPWDFWKERCMRTALACNPRAPRVRPTIPHCALSDDEAQALTIIGALNNV